VKLEAMIHPYNYYSQFYHPFCEQVRQLIPSTGGAILLLFQISLIISSISECNAPPPLLESVQLESDQDLATYIFSTFQ
jgi:hypothetical protein